MLDIKVFGLKVHTPSATKNNMTGRIAYNV